MFIPWLFLILPEGLSCMKGCAVQIDAAATVYLVPKVIKLSCILAAWRGGGEGLLLPRWQREVRGPSCVLHTAHAICWGAPLWASVLRSLTSGRSLTWIRKALFMQMPGNNSCRLYLFVAFSMREEALAALPPSPEPCTVQTHSL